MHCPLGRREPGNFFTASVSNFRHNEAVRAVDCRMLHNRPGGLQFSSCRRENDAPVERAGRQDLARRIRRVPRLLARHDDGIQSGRDARERRRDMRKLGRGRARRNGASRRDSVTSPTSVATAATSTHLVASAIVVFPSRVLRAARLSPRIAQTVRCRSRRGRPPRLHRV